MVSQSHPFLEANPKSAGFTIVELLVVMGVISVLSLLFVTGFRSDSRALALQRSAQLFVQGVDQSRSLSLSGGVHAGSVVEGGFGFFIQEGASEIVIFADCNQNGKYNDSGQSSPCGPQIPETVRTIPLEDGVSISSVTPCTSSGCTLTVVFRPPYATSDFDPNLTGSEAIIILQSVNGEIREIHVNKLGVSTLQ